MTSVRASTSTMWHLWVATAALVVLSIIFSAIYRLLKGQERSTQAQQRIITVFAWSTEAMQLTTAALGPVNAITLIKLLGHAGRINGLPQSEITALAIISLSGVASLHALAVYATHLADTFCHPDHGLEGGHDLKPFMLTRTVLSWAWRACAIEVHIYVQEPAPFPPMPRGWRDLTIKNTTSTEVPADAPNHMTSGQLLSPQSNTETPTLSVSDPVLETRQGVATNKTQMPDSAAHIPTAHHRSHQSSASGGDVFARLSARTGLTKRKTNKTSSVAAAVSRIEDH
ncbi:hypothetical protein LTR36_010480 [Oleoguttula mirabilis]|uniref:Uncharacterized protein n=1 Tax=Oleoguttula mirabilis TaxID=1507867 RepID=A0AAV9J3Z0_9PEZI|nr:hypothetical protein LTR36_010480 [Oleoguttula mirabilis]